jgi:hypothetical protein
MEAQRPQITKTKILGKKSNVEGIIIPDFTVYYRSIYEKQHGTGTKTDTSSSSMNSIEDPEINLHCYSHPIFDKGTKNMLWRRQPLQQMMLGKSNIHT